MDKYCYEVEPVNVPDLVAIIRCKDCKLRYEIMCPLTKYNFPDDKGDMWFCADGEQKDTKVVTSKTVGKHCARCGDTLRGDGEDCPFYKQE